MSDERWRGRRIGRWARLGGVVLGLLGALGCDDSGDAFCDGGACEPEPDAGRPFCEEFPTECGPEPDCLGDCDYVPGPEYTHVFLDDVSDEITDDGAPGVDVCGVRADCAGTTVDPTNAWLDPGTGGICGAADGDADADRPLCASPRNDPTATFSYANCDLNSDPSDYVSLGGGGRLVVTFGLDLQGCTLHLLEAGRVPRASSEPHKESAKVAVCADPEGFTCLTLDGDVNLGWLHDGDRPALIEVPVLE